MSVSLLYIFSTSLLYPVIAGLLILFAWSLALMGSLIQEYTTRRRDLKELEEASRKTATLAVSGKVEEAASVLRGYRSHKQVSRPLKDIAEALKGEHKRLRFEKILQDAELQMAKSLEAERIGVKAGPILGLMGTLIPMGPALIGLSQGEIRTMTDNLVIAFATTVIGLVVGGICYAALVVRSRWYRQDLSDLEYAAEIVMEEIS